MPTIYCIVVLFVSMVVSCIANITTTEYECYECTGYYMTETTCLETFPFGVPQEINTTICSAFCYKTIHYIYDKKAHVSRGCAEACEVDCYLSLDEGYCRYCCQENKCNTAINVQCGHPIQKLILVFSVPFLVKLLHIVI